MKENGKAEDRAKSQIEAVSRRDFMIKAGTVAGGLVLGAGCASVGSQGDAPSATGSPTLPKPDPIKYDAQNPLRIALIGTGGRMNGGLLPQILREENIEIIACADIHPKHLNSTLDRIEKAKGKRPPGYTAEDDYAQVLKRDDIQAVLSACPCDLHARIYLEAMADNKAIYGEKPACITLEEAKALKAAWPGAKSIVQIGFQRRVSPRYAEGIALLNSGELGEPWEGHAAWNNAGGPLGNDPDKIWLSQRARSGDWMLEQACHTWDVFGWVTGESLPVRATGMGRRDVYKAIQPARDVTDYYVATLEYPNGLIVNYNHTWFAPRRDNGAFSGVFERICGLKGGIDLGSGRVSYADEREPRLLHPQEPEMTLRSVAHFFECIREGKHPNSGIGNGVNASLTGLLVRTAVDERRTVTMDEITGGAIL